MPAVRGDNTPIGLGGGVDDLEDGGAFVIATWPGFAPAFVAKEKGFFGPVAAEIKVVDDFSARRCYRYPG